VNFFNAKVGYVIAEIDRQGKEAKYSTIFVLKTEDGGKSWTVLTKFTGMYLKGQFLNHNEIWMLNGRRLHHTIDGGKTWQQREYPTAIDLPDSPLMIFFDHNTGWLLSQSQSFISQGLYTTDGGKSWVKRMPRQIE
jgi:photosystem II stability/assembly factor-like uncharacterized protein